ncbi:Hypothetical predicted protein [Octopus vulgaris]|uniref:Uncharacterized protein n=1 Tax=Octopus vulgaris TaxID=6645 RepID=A0AA36BP34_OCTVU|nr:Hypothetical predicted protein [Octopus vulgaris]
MRENMRRTSKILELKVTEYPKYYPKMNVKHRRIRLRPYWSKLPPVASFFLRLLLSLSTCFAKLLMLRSRKQTKIICQEILTA